MIRPRRDRDALDDLDARCAGGPPDSAVVPAPVMSFSPDAADRRTGELLLIAAGVLGRRRALGRYPELTPRGVNGVVNTLTAIAIGEPPHWSGDRATVVALAHRILDDDHPERSALWARMTRH